MLMNLYLVDDCLYIAADSSEEAIKACENITGEVCESEPVKIECEAIKGIKIYDMGEMPEDESEEAPMIDLYSLFLEAEEGGVAEVLIEIEP